jgi:hypothetical protein
VKLKKALSSCKQKHIGRIICIPLFIFLANCNENKYLGDQTNTGITRLAPTGSDTSILVTTPPEELQLDLFYKKYLAASGMPIVGSEKVPDAAFYSVQKMVDEMISMRQDILDKMIENKSRIAIMAKTEVTTDVPEYRNWNDPSQSEGVDWNKRGRGFGATVELPLTSCAEENLLCYGRGIDGYYNEDIFIHEFAHSIHGLGILFIDTTIDKELQQALDNAIAKGLWKNTYAATNIHEYFAEGVQDWFNVNAKAFPANGVHNEIGTRQELKKYDPALYAIIKRYFPESNRKISCHQKD